MKCICALCGKKFNTLIWYSDICDSCLSSSTDVVDHNVSEDNSKIDDTKTKKSKSWTQLSFDLFDFK